MANNMYNKARQAFLEKGLSWPVDTFKAVQIDTAYYTFNAAHEFLSDVAALSVVGAAVTLASKTSVDGAARANSPTFATVTGPTIEALIIYQDTGVSTTSRLICYIDNAVGLPITPNGGDIIVLWDTGVNGIFRL